MKKIFLSSYFAGTIKQFQTFIQENSITAKRVLCIPTAGNVEDYTGYIDEEFQSLIDLGYQIDNLDVANDDTDSVVFKIQQAEILFITGGNTFYLLQELKRKNLLPLLVEKIQSGTPYIGESAGAIILAPSIEYNKIMDSPKSAPELLDYSGLGITNFYTLPHYIEAPFTKTVQETYNNYHKRLNLLPINNHKAIIVIGDNYRVV
ncbi:peptidase E [Leuconostoc pseudomesenteroides]|jgi:dipeptidase E|uniref:Type 1 glutamine amidotransferase-like domain-containing protein n=1 Tax=Leuconostoc falkenbergense TaxID=2766470 RepID=UPI000E0928CE|nr:Type 1 glutamine amidotransferase-like domain-containing protein [Leuconostoc falkenbergense]RDG19119.1 peptidase E [Leuconostoc pseudomesenteroides]